MRMSELVCETVHTAMSIVGLSSATDETLRHWERDLKPPLGPQDEAAIAHALDRCGKNRALLVKHFLGFVEFARKPLPAGARWR